MTFLENLAKLSILGEDLKFWVTICLGSLIKWLFTPNTGQTRKQAIGGIIAGGCAAYYGHDWIIRNISTITEQDKELVLIALVFTGEHLVRALLAYFPDLLRSQNNIFKDKGTS